MNRYALYGIVAGSTLGLLIAGGLALGVQAVGVTKERGGVNAPGGGGVLVAQDWRGYSNWGRYSNDGLFDRLRGAVRNELGRRQYGPYYRGGYGNGQYYSPYYGYSRYPYGYQPYYGGYGWW